MKNDEVFIVGGGPSLKGFDFSRLANKNTIAVNVAALDVPNPTYSITADSGTFRRLQQGYFKDVDTTWVVVTNPNHSTMKFKDGKFQHKSGFVYNPFATNILIRNAGVEGIGFSFKDFRTGYNSGFCALQLAVLLRYKKIYLLGFDLHPNEGHYHNRYGAGKTNKKDVDMFFNNFVLGLNSIARETDIKVFSCSQGSRLNTVIPFVSFEDIIKEPPPIEKIDVVDTVESTDEDVVEQDVVLEEPIQNITDEAPKSLSILICHIYERKKQLQRLLQILTPQKTDEVEILFETDNKKMSIGEKRNRLLEVAKGEYVVFIDDDDVVSADYVKKILEAIKTKPDCCSLIGEIYFRSKNIRRKFIHSMDYYKWEKQGEVYLRCPNHLNPVRRDLAIQIGFQNISKGEDLDFSMRLRMILRTEVKIEGTIYFYETN